MAKLVPMQTLKFNGSPMMLYTLRKTRAENSEPALSVSTEAMTNRLSIAPAYRGTRQIVRV